MKFLCPNCKAKYQISDEKISGRTLKMDCRRCNHPIVIRGDKAQRRSRPPSSSMIPSASRQRQSYAAQAPGGRNSGRGSLGADFRKNVSTAPAPAKPTALDQWHISINDVPVGPMKRDEVANKIASGAVNKSSLCWREGFDDWRELRSIPELAALLRRAAPPPTPKKAAFPPAPGRALGRSPVRVARPPSGSRPAAQQRPQPRPAAASRPAARGNVVPIGGRLGGGAAPALEEISDFLDEEPTRVGTAIDFEKVEAEQRLKEEDDRGRADAAEQALLREEEEARRQEKLREEEELRTEEEQKPVGLAPTAEIAHSDAFDPFASQAAAAPATGAPAATASIPGFSAPPGSDRPSVPMEAILERRRRAIPITAWIAIAGAMSFGMVLAIMVGTHYLTQPAPVAAAPAPQPEPRAPVEPELETEVPDDPTEVEEPPTAEVEEPTEAETTQGAAQGHTGGTGSTGRRTNNTGASTGGGRRERALTDDQRAALARAAGGSSASTPQLNPSRPDTVLEQDAQRRGGTSLNADQIRTVVTRERRGVTRCYETAVRNAGSAPAVRINVDITISGSGIVTRANARGQSFGNLSDCIERTVRRWHFPRTGAPSQTSLPFLFQGRD